jgi:hypothetical protein
LEVTGYTALIKKSIRSLKLEVTGYTALIKKSIWSLELEVTGYTALIKKIIWSQRLEVTGCGFLIHRKQLSLREPASPSHKTCTEQATVAVIFGRLCSLVLKKFQKEKVITLHFQASRVSTFGVVACPF